MQRQFKPRIQACCTRQRSNLLLSSSIDVITKPVDDFLEQINASNPYDVLTEYSGFLKNE
jgi:hypothetical protein